MTTNTVSSRSKDGVILSVNEEISGDRKKYQIINRYDLMVKTIDGSDTGRYLCQNFDQVLSMNIELTVLSKSPREARKEIGSVDVLCCQWRCAMGDVTWINATLTSTSIR